jgi:RHS repeat-associated protein
MGETSGTAEQVIALPKGGGAVRGIGEKFSPDLHTGTGNLTVPVEIPAGRGGFQPSLSLGYSSGSGNGPFGLGWSFSVPGVTRQTSRGLPTYADTLDTFVLSGAEDLVPVRTAPGLTQYRPRTEGLFARIEHHTGGGQDYWQVRTRDGQVSRYGTPRPDDAPAGWRDPAALADPVDPRRIFAWKLSETADPFGNVIAYEYETDSGGGLGDDEEPAWTQSYLRRIRYIDHPEAAGGFLVSVALDYEERPDVIGDRRAGFEVRTRRRCAQIAVHSAQVPDRPVRVQRLRYTTAAHNGCSLLTGVDVEGRDGDARQSLPTLTLGYTGFDTTGKTFAPLSGPDLPAQALSSPGLELVDLTGNGLPDILDTTGVVRFWRNLGDGTFTHSKPMADAPAGVTLADPDVTLLDADGDGRVDLMVGTEGLAGYFPLGADGTWHRDSFRRYEVAPSFAVTDPEVRLVDLDGDGVIDALRTGSQFECFLNDSQRGWRDTRTVPRGSYPQFPDVSFSDPRVRLGDMSGDGLQDIVLVHDGRVEYWPSLGRGDWSARREMRDSPRFPFGYDPSRILLADVDGDGLADLVYVDQDSVTVWVNRSGQGWSEPTRITGTPRVTDMSAVRLVDLHGHGTSGLLWTSGLDQQGSAPWRFLDLTGGVKPGLLTTVDNGMGATTRVDYEPSTRCFLRDESRPATRWSTTLPVPVQVVSRVRTEDHISGTTVVTTYAHHDGYWDGAEREFRGFGRVDQRDSEQLIGADAGTAPLETRTWFHQGPVGPEVGDWVEHGGAASAWPEDPGVLTRPAEVSELLDRLPRRDRRDAVRALRGSVLRTEVYQFDGSDRQGRPVTVTEHLTGVREESPPQPGEAERRRIFFPHQLATRTTRWDRGTDPMIQLSYSGGHDAYGLPPSQTAVAVPRGRDLRSAEPGEPCLVTHAETAYAHRDDDTRYLIGRVASTASYEVLDDGRSGVLAVCERVLVGDLTRAVRGQTLNAYDGAAFEGLPYGQLGEHGVLSRSETLVLTMDILAQACADGSGGAALPPYLDPARADDPAWIDRYPVDFRDRMTPLAGYVFHPGGDGSPHVGGYYTVTRHAYDVQQAPAGEPARGLPVLSRDPFGGETTTRYDRFAVLPAEITDAAGLVTRADHDYRVFRPREVTDPNGNRSAARFTPLGLVDRVAALGAPGDTGGDTLEVPGTRMTYDLHAFADRGEPVSIRTVRRVHHTGALDVPAEERDAVIETVELSDGFGRVVQTRTQAEDVAFGDPVFGGLEVTGDGPAEITGRPRADAGPPRVTVSGWQVYDAKGRVVAKYEPFFGTGYGYAPPGEAELGRKVTTTYDPRGRVVRTTHPDGSEQRVVHGIPVQLTDPDVFEPTPWEAYTYDANDNAGRTHQGLDPADATHRDTPTSVVVDPMGRAVRTVQRNGPGRGDWHTTSAEYDIAGNLLARTDELDRVAFRHVYDLAGRSWRTDQLDGGTHLTVVDAAGQPVEQRDSRGALGLHAYDMAHRPVRVWLADAGDRPTTLRQVLVYGDAADAGLTRDEAAAGNLRGVVIRHYDDAGVTVTEHRDLDGNVTESVRRVVADAPLTDVYDDAAADGWQVRAWRVDWQPPAGVALDAHAAGLLGEAEYRSSSVFDAVGRPRSTRLPADVEGHRAVVRPRYNSAGGLRGVDLDDETYVEQIGYDAKGQRTLIVHGNGVLTRYAYDADTFRLARLRTERFTAIGPQSYRTSGPPLQDFAYRYDLVGNLTGLTDRTPGSGIPANPAAGRVADPALARLVAAGEALVREFGYDARYRLVSATGREHDLDPARPPWDGAPPGGDVTRARGYAHGYDYDRAGNLLRMTHQAGTGMPTRTFALQPGGNRLSTVTIGGDVIGYAYDAAGNVVSESESRHLEWDGTGRLSTFRVQVGSAEPSIHAQYLYDASGQRVRKVVRRQGGQVDSTTYVGGVFEHFRQVTAGAVRESTTVHVVDDEQRVALVRVGELTPGDATPPVTYQVGDHLGSAVLVLDNSGGEVSREEFTPYGETSFGGHALKRYRFTGTERDEESGLGYHGARYYAPWLARWTATDPAGPVDGLNLYQYARSSPVMWTDPSGTQSASPDQQQATGTSSAAPATTVREQAEQQSLPEEHATSSKESTDLNDHEAYSSLKMWSTVPKAAVRRTKTAIDVAPTILGLAPTDLKANLRPAEHALEEYVVKGIKTQYISASMHPFGASNIEGDSLLWINIDRATALGSEFVSEEALSKDMEALVQEHPQRYTERAEMWRRAREREVLFKGVIDPRAIDTVPMRLLRYGGRGLQIAGAGLAAYDMAKATTESVRTESVKPVAAETLRQVGSWGLAWAGAKAGAAAGAAVGGPGAVLTGLGVALAMGTAGYLGADWIADFVHPN